MAFRKSYKKKTYGRKSYRKQASGRPRKVARVSVKRIRSTVNNMSETKRYLFTAPDDVDISHNNFISLTDNLLKTRRGDDNGGGAVNGRSRDGNEIYCKGVGIRMMLENKVDRSEVTYRLMVVKSAKGDIPIRDTLFQGITGNKMLDYVDTSRYTLMMNKYFKIKAPNQGTSASINVNGTYNTADIAGDDIRRMTPGTKLIKLYIPINKKVSYLYTGGATGIDDSPKFFDYHVLLYAYDHFGTAQDINVLGTVNDYTQLLYFKDI